jgi:hypothetical protein
LKFTAIGCLPFNRRAAAESVADQGSRKWAIGGWGGKSGETAGSSSRKPGIRTTGNPGFSLHLPLHSNRIAGSRFKKGKSNDNAVFYPQGDNLNFALDINQITSASTSSEKTSSD